MPNDARLGSPALICLDRCLHGSSQLKLTEPKPSGVNGQQEYTIAFSIRFVCYLLAVAVTFEVVVLLVGWQGWDKVILEGRIVENAQLDLIFLTLAALLVLAIRHADARALYILMIYSAAAAAIRETSAVDLLENFVRQSLTWVIIIATFLILVFVLRHSIFRQIRLLLARPRFLLLVLGLFLVVWAQLLTQRNFMDRKANRTMEEVLELAGYILIFAGVIEEFISKRTIRARFADDDKIPGDRQSRKSDQ